MQPNDLGAFLSGQIIAQFPTFLLATFALVVMVVHTQRSLVGSLLIFLGLGLLTIGTIGTVGFSWYVSHHQAPDFKVISVVFACLFSLRNSSLFFFVLAAIVGRPPRASKHAGFNSQFHR